MDDKLINIVQSTKDYGQFSLMAANRNINKFHVKALRDAIEKDGNFTKAQPILVNDKYQVIDGQHRLFACKELGYPIYFTVVPGLGITEARNINILHSNWTPIDFAHSYAEQGNKIYAEYLKFREEFGFTHTLTVVYMNNNFSKGQLAKFRRGELVLADLEDTLKHLNLLDECRDQLPATIRAVDRSLGVAFLYCFKTEGYNNKRMINKLHLYGQEMKSFTKLNDNRRQLEEIYNFRQQDNSKLRLF